MCYYAQKFKKYNNKIVFTPMYMSYSAQKEINHNITVRGAGNTRIDKSLCSSCPVYDALRGEEVRLSNNNNNNKDYGFFEWTCDVNVPARDVGLFLKTNLDSEGSTNGYPHILRSIDPTNVCKQLEPQTSL
jgi:hypothetical protein